MNLTINNQAYLVADEDPDRLLLWVLRDELGLVGTKFGCGAGICGACTVHVDGVATRACQTPLSRVAGAAIRTVEGLAGGDGQLHPVQQAFLQVQAPQCSWCMNGQMMTAVAFLEQTPDPTPTQVVEAMRQNYCRCGCYARLKQAVVLAADLMKAAA